MFTKDKDGNHLAIDVDADVQDLRDRVAYLERLVKTLAERAGLGHRAARIDAETFE